MVVVDAARKVDEMTLNIVDRLAREKPRLKASEFLLVLNKVRPPPLPGPVTLRNADPLIVIVNDPRA